VSPFGDFSTPKIKIKIKITTENATLKKKKEAQQISQENSSHPRAFIIFQSPISRSQVTAGAKCG